MSFSVNYAGNGNFTVVIDGRAQTLNLADINTMLRMEQVAEYDKGIADQLAEIQKTNQQRKALNKLLSIARSSKSKRVWSVEWSSHSGGKHSLPGESGQKDVKGWMQHYGIDYTHVTGSGTTFDSKWDANINAIKSQIDNITSDSEMQMLRFRQMVDKRGTALQEAKTTLNNDKRLKDAIVQG